MERVSYVSFVLFLHIYSELYEHHYNTCTGKVLFTAAKTLCQMLETDVPMVLPEDMDLPAVIHELACQAITACHSGKKHNEVGKSIMLNHIFCWLINSYCANHCWIHNSTIRFVTVSLTCCKLADNIFNHFAVKTRPKIYRQSHLKCLNYQSCTSLFPLYYHACLRKT